MDTRFLSLAPSQDDLVPVEVKEFETAEASYHRTSMAVLTPAELTEQLKSVEGWTLDGAAIRKEFVFQDFPEAVLFVSALVPGAEDADHHPDIEIHYKRVILVYSTHSEGGITGKDIDGAAMADAVADSLPHLEEFGDG